jgi:demethylmenaquinone methyltransferase/2-methoxy-6-polyprenyl-1,4-benzoquinol methylase
VAPVQRSTSEARATYDRLDRWYDVIEAPFERRARAAGLRLLDARVGERILEIGFGTGHTLAALGAAVGEDGLVVGVDLSLRMALRCRRRLRSPTGTATAVLL